MDNKGPYRSSIGALATDLVAPLATFTASRLTGTRGCTLTVAFTLFGREATRRTAGTNTQDDENDQNGEDKEGDEIRIHKAYPCEKWLLGLDYLRRALEQRPAGLAWSL